IELVKGRGETLEAVNLADRVGEMIETQAHGQIEVLGYAEIVGPIKAQLVERYRHLGARRKALHDLVAGSCSAPKSEIAETGLQNQRGCVQERPVADVRAAEASSEAEAVAAMGPTEVVCELILSRATTLRNLPVADVKGSIRRP